MCEVWLSFRKRSTWGPKGYKRGNLKTALFGLMFTCALQKNMEGRGKLNVKSQTVAMKRSMIMGQQHMCVCLCPYLRHYQNF